MIKLKTIINGVLIIVFYTVFSLIADGHHTITFPATLLIIFIATIVHFNKSKSISLLNCLFLVLPMILLFVTSGFFIKDYSRIIPYLIFIPISSLLAIVYLKSKKIIIIPISIFLFYVFSICFFNTLFIYVSNIDAEKNIAFATIHLVNDKKAKVELGKNKIIVLDFWSTACGKCFEKFPDFEKICNKYRTNKNINFYAVNVPIERRDKFEKTIKILCRLGYKFPSVYATSSSEINNKLHFKTFPHLIIIKDSRIRYDGMFETENNTLIFSIESEIEKLLKE